MADSFLEGTGEYASTAHDRLFDRYRTLGSSGSGNYRGVAFGPHFGGCGSYAAFLSDMGSMAV
jgi:hypothetical protein